MFSVFIRRTQRGAWIETVYGVRMADNGNVAPKGVRGLKR